VIGYLVLGFLIGFGFLAIFSFAFRWIPNLFDLAVNSLSFSSSESSSGFFRGVFVGDSLSCSIIQGWWGCSSCFSCVRCCFCNWCFVRWKCCFQGVKHWWVSVTCVVNQAGCLVVHFLNCLDGSQFFLFYEGGTWFAHCGVVFSFVIFVFTVDAGLCIGARFILFCGSFSEQWAHILGLLQWTEGFSNLRQLKHLMGGM